MENDIKRLLAKRIKALREKKGITQEQLADLSGIDYKHIQKLEGKKPSAAQIDTLEKLAKALGVKLASLLNI